MRYSSAFKASVVVLLLLTLPWKLSVRSASDGNMEGVVSEFLIRHGFQVSTVDDADEYMPRIYAKNDTCQMRIARASYYGANRDVVLRLAGETEHVFFVFQGSVFPQQPTRLTLVDHLWNRFLGEIGTTARESPVLAILASPHCNAQELPWAELPFER